ncbi:hypothetical protein POM88_037021 [Heracleum sosnowskyi]|uniref:PHD-type domain-containing protein n=1 Tax=Heracleum sosnowskyi TaxID=360622 RepID=A0AAD8HPG4_9APIA|nr:hypothetical protein POM88_037021 [Heracleum sosnowskyi]
MQVLVSCIKGLRYACVFCIFVYNYLQVCDTCGDIGREYLFVVCCRCSDGAEHTYCMPKMLDKIPEGGWMCQQCKMEERKDSSCVKLPCKRNVKSGPFIAI